MENEMEEKFELSKYDELKLLEEFAAKFGPNTYLHSLLNPRLIEWVGSCIRCDLPADIWETMGRYIKEAHDLRHTAAAQQKDLVDLRQRLATIVTQRNDARRELAQTRQRVEAQIKMLELIISEVGENI